MVAMAKPNSWVLIGRSSESGTTQKKKNASEVKKKINNGDKKMWQFI